MATKKTKPSAAKAGAAGTTAAGKLPMPGMGGVAAGAKRSATTRAPRSVTSAPRTVVTSRTVTTTIPAAATAVAPTPVVAAAPAVTPVTTPPPAAVTATATPAPAAVAPAAAPVTTTPPAASAAPTAGTGGTIPLGSTPGTTAATPPPVTPVTRHRALDTWKEIVGVLLLIALVGGTIYIIFKYDGSNSNIVNPRERETVQEPQPSSYRIVDKNNTEVKPEGLRGQPAVPNISVENSTNTVITLNWGDNVHFNGSSKPVELQKSHPAPTPPTPVWPEGSTPSRTEKILENCDESIENVKKIVVTKTIASRTDVMYVTPRGWRIDPTVWADWSQYQVVYNTGTLENPKWIPAPRVQSDIQVVAYWFKSLSDEPIRIQFDCERP